MDNSATEKTENPLNVRPAPYGFGSIFVYDSPDYDCPQFASEALIKESGVAYYESECCYCGATQLRPPNNGGFDECTTCGAV